MTLSLIALNAESCHTVFYTECLNKTLYVGRQYAECRYAKCLDDLSTV
jgi:hypothetical protein